MSSNPLFAASRSGLFFIAGPCVLEGLEPAMKVARSLAELKEELGAVVVFKSSFDKANRSSIDGFRGPGLEKGLRWLETIKLETGLPILTDIHLPEQAEAAARIADVLQIPAFLSRQTDLLVAAAGTGAVINVKKGQFLAPWDMQEVVRKIRQTGNDSIWLTERGATFGYNNLVVDFRSLAIMKEFGVPVVFDATHSVQLPGGQGKQSGGQREYVPLLARAAAAAGCDGVFMETHPDPDTALCDGPNMWPLSGVGKLFQELLAISRVRTGKG
ncbi:MAG: 3-deoxy-8-phosphooctulonate synthase [Desulfohalobiaceae bacterium]|nr:3-deoxy-8-phosphooctulonate synthase [Desulfohalobiaceae bacterium]